MLSNRYLFGISITGMAHLQIGEEVTVSTSNLQRFARTPKRFNVPTERLQNTGHSSALEIPFNLKTGDLPYLDRLQTLFPNSLGTLSKMYSGPFSKGTIKNYDLIVKKFENLCLKHDLPYPEFSEFSVVLFFHQSLEAKETYSFFQSVLPALAAVERARGATTSAITPFVRDMKNTISRNLAPFRPPTKKAENITWAHISDLYVKEFVEKDEAEWDRFNFRTLFRFVIIFCTMCRFNDFNLLKSSHFKFFSDRIELNFPSAKNDQFFEGIVSYHIKQ